jgi:hypothetical protein
MLQFDPRGKAKMNEMTGSTRRIVTAAGCAFWALGLTVAADVLAQSETVNAAITEQVKTEQAAQTSQEHVEKLDEEADKMLAEYRQIIAEAKSLKVYNEQLAGQVESQQEEMETMNAQLAQIETTSREVVPLMQNMLNTLDQFVKLDTPFLPEERSKRVEVLKETMGRADVTISEKYRRIVEAYQIEMEYGRTIESYEGKVGDKTVEFLRAGRIALMYQTLDGMETGYWDADAKTWQKDDSYKDAITAGLKVAKKQSAPDFLSVPVHAPEGGV